MITLPPLALYVHVPWCVRKCPYCDFNSHRAPQRLPTAAYIQALLDDLDLDIASGAVQERRLVSIFIGGGTPSLFSPADIDRLLTGIKARIPWNGDIEITLEANPGAVERGSFAEYRAAGVNRISVGVQSFANESLQRLGRIHSGNDVLVAVNELHAAGFTNFNLDLMYALPEQTLEAAIADLETAIGLRPAHISHYELTLEPGTVFYSRPPPLPDADLAWLMQEECQARLAAAGYEQYEVSAYARPGAQCRHNLNYWLFGDYLGIGAGAHGKITRDGSLIRSVREKQPARYLKRSAPERVQIGEVPPETRIFEFMLNVLRLRTGFTLEAFEAGTGVSRARIAAPLREARAKGLLTQVGELWQTTELGRRFLNDLQSFFLPQSSQGSAASA